MIEKYTTSGVFLYAFATGFPYAGPIEVDTDGNIYLGAGPDANAPQIQKFSRTGAPIQSWTVPAWPQAMTRGPGGKLYVSSLLGSPR